MQLLHVLLFVKSYNVDRLLFVSVLFCEDNLFVNIKHRESIPGQGIAKLKRCEQKTVCSNTEYRNFLPPFVYLLIRG